MKERKNMKKTVNIKEKWKEWMCFLLSSLLIPCMITLFVSGTSATADMHEAGIVIEYPNGQKTDMEVFLLYMIAAQADIDSDEDALKAQAVIARTNLLRELEGRTEAKAQDLSLTYLTPEKFESSFGEKKKEEIYKKLRNIVSDTFPMVMMYNNNYIEALYHSVSIGTTVSAEEIYGIERPYLVEVDSSQDVESEEYMALSNWSAGQLLEKLHNEGKAKEQTTDTIFSALHIKEKTENGYVMKVAIGNETMTGEEWKILFGLNSTNFYLEEYEGVLRMVTLGKGHGVGLSQYGANALAKKGWTWEEILKKYYSGISIVEFE